MRVVLGVSGGIAAYKTPDLVRRLRDVGAEVRVIMTPNAARFVTPLALATANVLAKLAVGIADDALTTYALAHRAVIVVAPAMNTFMLQHPTVRQNLETLRARGVVVLDPDSGLLACGDEGAGRMPDPPAIAELVKRHLGAKDLDGRSIVVTAGPTREAIDPVRYISNRSSGKMGYALAEAAARRGARVTLISGPTSLTPPSGISVERVTTALEMRDAVLRSLEGADVVIK